MNYICFVNFVHHIKLHRSEGTYFLLLDAVSHNSFEFIAKLRLPCALIILFWSKERVSVLTVLYENNGAPSEEKIAPFIRGRSLIITRGGY